MEPISFWVDTDQYGLILDSADDALPALGYTHTSIRGRSLLLMFLSQKPGTYHFDRVISGHPLEREGILRPVDQRARAVRYRIALAPHSSQERTVLRWDFTAL